MNAFLAKLHLLYTEAKGKLTTYVGLSIAGLSALGANAEDLIAQWPAIAAYLPKAHVIDVVSHYALSALGILAAVARVRRLVWPPKAAT